MRIYNKLLETATAPEDWKAVNVVLQLQIKAKKGYWE